MKVNQINMACRRKKLSSYELKNLLDDSLSDISEEEPDAPAEGSCLLPSCMSSSDESDDGSSSEGMDTSSDEEPTINPTPKRQRLSHPEQFASTPLQAASAHTAAQVFPQFSNATANSFGLQNCGSSGREAQPCLSSSKQTSFDQPYTNTLDMDSSFELQAAGCQSTQQNFGPETMLGVDFRALATQSLDHSSFLDHQMPAFQPSFAGN